MATQESSGRRIMCQGRIVWTSGDLFKGKVQTDDNGNPRPNKEGQPTMQFGFGLAVPKQVLQDPKLGEIWPAMQEETFAIYPSRQLPPDYAWKYKDGDGVDHNGAPFNSREGYAGCLVFALTTQIAIKYFRNENGQNFQINEGIKCGDYVQVQVAIKAHGPAGRGKAGLYLNPEAVLFLCYGKEIINAPTGDQIFGTKAPSFAMPPGASAQPIAPTGFIVPTGQPMGGQPMPGYGQTNPQPGNAYQQQATPPAAPHHGILPQQFQPPGQNMAPQSMPGYGPGPGMAQPGSGNMAQGGYQQPPGFAPGTQQTAPPGMPGMPGMGQPPQQPAYNPQSNAGFPGAPQGMPSAGAMNQMPANPFPGAQMPQAPIQAAPGYNGGWTPQ